MLEKLRLLWIVCAKLNCIKFSGDSLKTRLKIKKCENWERLCMQLLHDGTDWQKLLALWVNPSWLAHSQGIYL